MPEPSIARIWRGRVPAHRSDEYLAYLRSTGLTEYAATPGNRGVHVLRRTQGEVTEFALLTFWESMDAVRRFAGDEPERARYYPEDARFLLEMPDRVEHWELVSAASGPMPRPGRDGP